MTRYKITFENGRELEFGVIDYVLDTVGRKISAEILLVQAHYARPFMGKTFGYVGHLSGNWKLVRPPFCSEWAYEAIDDWCGYTREPHDGERLMQLHVIFDNVPYRITYDHSNGFKVEQHERYGFGLRYVTVPVMVENIDLD